VYGPRHSGSTGPGGLWGFPLAKDSHLDHLASIPLLSALSRKELQLVARASDEVTVGAGHELIRQGDIGREMFVLVDGEASVHRNGRKIGTASPGRAFGELALLDKGPRSATVTADTPCTVLVLGAREFAGVLDEVPGIARKLLSTLASQVRELDAKIYG
jgi:CRP/FNR family cyclic AMP-dependent transcriptional regulator